MRQSTQPDYYRCAFEMISGSLNNRRWKQIRAELERSGIVVNLKSVQSYALLKTQYPRTVLTKKAIKAVENFQENYHPTHEFLGEELLDIMRRIKPHVGDRMLINFFYKASLQFGKQNTYTLSEASKVVFFTAISRNK
jgi:uncharacterized protein YbcI